MSHCPDGRHVWGAGSTEEVVNEAGERKAVIAFRCCAPRCGGVRYEQGALIEPADVSEFRHIQEVGEEPSD